jgi:manganese efflux pump family protein
MAIAALVTWIITAGFGFFMLGTWISGGGTRAGGASHFRPPVVFGHFLLAAGGLVVWIIYVLNDATTLAWVAFVDLVVVAVIGDVLVVRWTKDRRGGTDSSMPTATAGSRAGRDTMTAQTSGQQLAEQRIPTPAVLVHGLFAVTTVVLVLLSALGVGGS